MYKSIIVVFLAATAASIAEAELTFGTSSFEGTAEFGQERVPFEFPFLNTGAYPVEITDVRTSCGCTTSGLEKRLYQPGESGVIEGNFSVGSRQGTHRQHIHVETDDPTQDDVKLNVMVTIPELISITPKLVNWRINEAPELKSVELVPDVSRGLEVTDVTVDSDDFVVELIRSEDPEEPLELMIAPAITDAANRGLIKISTTYDDGESRDFFVHAMVR